MQIGLEQVSVCFVLDDCTILVESLQVGVERFFRSTLDVVRRFVLICI
jgi:hypothetical protein